MKTITVLSSLLLVFLLVGCSAGQTSQDQLEKDTQDIKLDPNAAPVDGGAQKSPMKGGGQ